MSEMALLQSARRRHLKRKDTGGKLEQPFEAWTAWSSTISVAIFFAGAVAADIISYVTEGSAKPDLVVGVVAALAVVAGLLPRPRHIQAPAIALGAYLLVFFASLKNQWVGPGQTAADVARACVPVVLSILCFGAGVSLRQRARPFLLWLLLALAGVLFTATVVMAFGILHTAKNTMGGVMFELAMLMVGLVYALTGKFSPAWGFAALALIVGGALLTNHRMMIGLGILIGGGLIGFSYFKPRWARLVPPLVGICVGIFTIMTFTVLANTDAMREADAHVKAESGRSAMSGRQEMWDTVINAIVTGPKIGYGPTAKAEDFTGLVWSTHNGFMQVGLQTGLVGIFVVLCIFGTLTWRAYTAAPEYADAGAMLSLLIMGVIIHNSSENVLFTNNFPIAAMSWLNIGFYFAATRLKPLAVIRRSSAQAQPSQAVRRRRVA